jgi:hypothetical protein
VASVTPALLDAAMRLVKVSVWQLTDQELDDLVAPGESRAQLRIQFRC